MSATPVRPTIQGDRLALRPMEVSDAEPAYLAWMRDPEVTRHLESRFVEHTAPSLRAYIEATTADERNHFFAIVLGSSSRHIGNIKLGPVDEHHRHGDIGILLGERDCWGRGYASEAIGLLATYAFDALGLHKLTAGAYASNVGSLGAFRRVGFEVEGRRVEQYLTDDGWVDGILLGRVAPAVKA